MTTVDLYSITSIIVDFSIWLTSPWLLNMDCHQRWRILPSPKPWENSWTQRPPSWHLSNLSHPQLSSGSGGPTTETPPGNATRNSVFAFPPWTHSRSSLTRSPNQDPTQPRAPARKQKLYPVFGRRGAPGCSNISTGIAWDALGWEIAKAAMLEVGYNGIYPLVK